ncbi:hypothetical protein AVEN_270690-1 [Araneus ventricosus]|uniref:Uncharacterized protein n=1 Tax=Araneus ventricosus TaxID=182803 RepID=A0A4Y2FY76_ARAVE|nr:hypothetical protein AVEN_270690-1 [Araneus ventricosus]
MARKPLASKSASCPHCEPARRCGMEADLLESGSRTVLLSSVYEHLKILPVFRRTQSLRWEVFECCSSFSTNLLSQICKLRRFTKRFQRPPQPSLATDKQ